MTQVKKGERKDNKKGPWLVLTYVKPDGTEKTTNIFEADIIECFKGPGKYEITWVKNGQYYNVSKLELMKLDGEPTGAEPQKPAAATPAPQGPGAAAVVATLGRTEVALRCLEAAAKVMAASITAGRYDQADIDTINRDVTVTAGAFMGGIKNLTTSAAPAAAKPEGA